MKKIMEFDEFKKEVRKNPVIGRKLVPLESFSL